MDNDFMHAEFLCYQCDEFGNSDSSFRDAWHFTEANGYSVEQIAALVALKPAQSIDISDGITGEQYYIMRVN